MILIALMKWIEGLKEDPEVLAAIEEGDSNPIDFLEASVGDIISSMDMAGGELDKMIERSGSSTRRLILLSDDDDYHDQFFLAHNHVRRIPRTGRLR